MDGKMLRHFYDAVQAAAVAAHGKDNVPVVTVGMYNGLNANDEAVSDVKENLVAHWYTENFSQSSLKEYLEAGWQVRDPHLLLIILTSPNPHGPHLILTESWQVVDITWVPLYIASPIFTPETVFSLFNLFRASAQQHTDPPTNEQYWVPGREAQTLGAIMSTWTAHQPDELGIVRMRCGPFAEHAWNYLPYPYPESGAGSWAEFVPRSADVDKRLDRLIGPLIRNYQCEEATLQCQPAPVFPNGSSWTNGSDYLADCGNHPGNDCCGKPCPGPPVGSVYGGRLYVTTGGPSTNMSFHGQSGIAAADAYCASQAPAGSGLPAAHYKALLSDEAGCDGKPCRRASVTPGKSTNNLPLLVSSRPFHKRTCCLV